MPCCSVVIIADRIRIGPWLPADTVNFDIRLHYDIAQHLKREEQSRIALLTSLVERNLAR